MLSSQLRPDEVPTSEDKWNATTLQESGPRGPEIRIYRFIVYIKKAQRLITHFCREKNEEIYHNVLFEVGQYTV